MRHLRHLLAREGQEAGTGTSLSISRADLRRHIVAALVIVGLAGLAAALHVSLCPFATLTGVPCPGCGILRATVALLRGDVAGSLHAHPLALLAIPTAIVGVRRTLATTPWARAHERAFTAVAALVVCAMLAVWIARFQGALGGPVAVNSIWN